MRSWVIAGTLVLVACTKDRPKPVDAGTEAAPVASAAPDASIGPSAFSLPGIPAPPPPRAAPIRVEGFPSPLEVGMSDAAYDFGFTSNGTHYAYCQFDVCCAGNYSYCNVFDEHGGKTSIFTSEFPDEKPIPPDAGTRRTTKEEVDAFPKREGLRHFEGSSKSPPPATGNILYGDEITFEVLETKPVYGEKDGSFKMGSVRVGGKLAGEQPVFVAFPPPDKACLEYSPLCFEVQLNDFAVSPAGDEVVFLIYARASSHGSFLRADRMSVASLAGSIFNDTGMAHHKKKEWARAGELFTRAVYADPTKELFAYNLACALAAQKDKRAEVALHRAIALGGAAVKKRAAADADFAGVKTEAWFVALTR